MKTCRNKWTGPGRVIIIIIIITIIIIIIIITITITIGNEGQVGRTRKIIIIILVTYKVVSQVTNPKTEVPRIAGATKIIASSPNKEAPT